MGKAEENPVKLSAMCAFLLGMPAWVRAYFINKLPVRTVEKDTFRYKTARILGI